MERLTFDGNFCDIAQCGEVPGGSFCENGACSQKKVWMRLKAYEDTGLSPEDCAEYKKFEDEIIASGKTFGRLIELLNADKDGRVVVLPCRVGDIVYFAYAHPILQYKVTGYKMGKASISRVHSKHVDEETGIAFDFTFRPSSIGKTVFLTREEAEKALAEMEGKA